jgi:hypothetical protein
MSVQQGTGGESVSQRSHTTQSEHDEVVAGIAGIYVQRGFRAWANPGQEHNQPYANVYPDVIVGLQDGPRILEVETEDSVNEAEASQWQEYGALFRFGLVVPAACRILARMLLDARALGGVGVIPYVRNPDGTFTLHGLPGL